MSIERLDVLDRNLAALLTRAYVAVRARESFREQLERDFLARATQLGRRAGTRTRVASLPVLRIAAAAAILLGVFAGGVWYARRDEPGLTLDAILARGEVAVRRERDGAWTPAANGPIGVDGNFLEVRTPATRPARVESGEGKANWELAGASQLVLDRGADSVLDTDLGAGGVVVESEGARAARLKTTEGELRLERGSVRLAYEPPQDPDAWEPRPDASRPYVHVSVRGGRALATRKGAELSLDGGAEAYLSGGETLIAVAAGVSTASNDQRASVDVEQPPRQSGQPSPSSESPTDAILVGTVTRASDGAPVEEFLVVLLPRVALPQVGRPLVQDFHAAHGHFEFPRSEVTPEFAQASSYRLEIQSRGLAPFRIERMVLAVDSPSAAPSIDAVLDEGATVRGIVLDEASGLPIAGAYVVSENDTPLGVLAIDPKWEPGSEAIVVSTHTQNDGSFELAHLSAGPQILRATAPGHGPQWTPPMTLARGETTTDIELRLAAAARIEGSVLDARAEPIEEVLLLAAKSDFTSKRPCLTFDMAYTASDGSYAIDNLGAGTWAVLNLGPVNRLKTSLTPEMAFAELRAGVTSRVDFHAVLPHQVLRGFVRDTAGRPVGARNVMVSLVEKAGPPPDGEWTSAMTSATDGSYEIPNLEPGAYEMFISGRVPSEMVYVGRFEVPQGRASTHDVVLPLGAIAGRISDGVKHQPLDFATLVLFSRSASGAEEFMGKSFSSDDGSYAFEYLPAGVYTLYAYSPNPELGQERYDPIDVADGARVEHVDFELVAGASMLVRVLDSAGKPIERATIETHDAGGHDVQFAEIQRTKVDGTYEAVGVKPGRWRVRASAPNFQSASREVDVAAGERPVVEIRLSRAGEQH